uniref:Mechanosensory protein 2 n=1 Tax=Schistocephalus solidus TaxID=70667 RepID=A0A0V0J9F3_SCHSO
MGKTLMDGKSKAQRPSKSESFESFRGPLITTKMQQQQLPQHHHQPQHYPQQQRRPHQQQQCPRPPESTLFTQRKASPAAAAVASTAVVVRRDYQSPEPESIREEEIKDSHGSDKKIEQTNRAIVPSAPPRINTPDGTEQLELTSYSNQPTNPHMAPVDVLDDLSTVGHDKANAEDCSMEKEKLLKHGSNSSGGSHSPRRYRMNSFQNDSEGFMEELEISQSTDWMTSLLTVLSYVIVVLTFPFSMFFCLKTVAEYERAVVLRMGRLLPDGHGTKGPGLFFILPCIDSIRKVELRTVTFSIPPQEVLTRDSVTVAVDAVVYYRICNPAVSFLNVEDAARSTRLLAQTTLRNVLGTKDLAQILMDREEMSVTMQSTLDSATEAWGVKVERVEIKDVRLPVALQRAMAAEAEATREARARVIAATGEHRASSALKEAAKVIASSPMALQLRYLQTMCAISAEKNSTIIFPLPIDILQTGISSGTLLENRPRQPSDMKHALVKGWLPSIPDYSPRDKSPSPESGQQRLTEDSTGPYRLPEKEIGKGTEEGDYGMTKPALELHSPAHDGDYDTYSDSV